MSNKNRYWIDTVQLPTWALCAIHGDDSGLSDNDSNALDNFFQRYPQNKFTIDYGTEEYFSWRNELNNLGDNVVDCKIYRIPRKYNRKVR